MSAWTTNLDKFYKIGDAWVRESAIDVIEPTADGTGAVILTRAGEAVYDLHRTPDELVDRIFRGAES